MNYWQIFVDIVQDAGAQLNQYQGLFLVLFTFLLVVFNRSLARETTRLRKKATEPQIDVYLVPAHDIPALNLIVRNSGGEARDVQWKIHADAEDLKAHNVYIMQMELFTSQSYFPANERFEFFFGFGGNLMSNPPLKPIDIDVSYNNEWKSERVRKSFRIEITPFKGRLTTGRAPLREIATRLESIQRDIGRIASGSAKINVLTQSKADYVKEIEEFITDSKKQKENTQPTPPG